MAGEKGWMTAELMEPTSEFFHLDPRIRRDERESYVFLPLGSGGGAAA